MVYISKTKLKQLEEKSSEPNTEVKELILGMQELVEAIKDISLRVSKIENEVSLPKEQPKPETRQAQITEDSVYPVPIDYRAEVEKKLNKKFGIRVEPHEGATFRFTILVPREYSPLNDNEWEMSGGEDKRLRVITYSDGINGVREWIDKVYNNLDMETRAKIQADRINL